MKNDEFEIRLVSPKGLEKFFMYLNDHLSDNGKEAIHLFQPLSRKDSRLPKENEASVTKGSLTPVSQAEWRRVWIAVDQNEEILSHIDLRAHPNPYTEHRALFGMREWEWVGSIDGRG
jgi:hypothetical protein